MLRCILSASNLFCVLQQVRGRLVLLYELLLCSGMLGSVLADVALMKLPDNWRWMVGMPVLPAAVLAGTMRVLSWWSAHFQEMITCGTCSHLALTVSGVVIVGFSPALLS